MDLKVINVGLSKNELDKKANMSPIDALKEVIWNACDADATKIDISLEKTKDGGIDIITKIIIQDNGHGLSYDKTDKAFDSYGDSEKLMATKSPSGRTYHGKMGQGRYSYFALGSSIIWESVYKDNGNNSKITATFNESDKKKVVVSTPVIATQKTGMTVNISGILKKLNLEQDKVIPALLIEFAGYLLAHKDITISFDGIKIDVEQNLDSKKEYTHTFTKEDSSTVAVEIEVIKWKGIKAKQKFTCGLGNVVYLEDKLKVSENVCMYIASAHYDEKKKQGIIDADNFDETSREINEYAENCLADFLNIIRNKDDAELLVTIKGYEAYPFEEVITDTVLQKQREIFDIVAIEIERAAPIKDNKVRKLSYKLVKEAINTNPNSLKTILDEVFNLPKEKQDELASILGKTSLNNIITTMQEVSNRLTFLETLHEIVYGNDKATKYMKERTEFQPLLLQELWIFGDHYKYGTDDQSLRNVLKKYSTDCLGHDIELTDDQRKNKDYNKIPDICLWNKQKIDHEKFENLMVEIKRPSKVLGQTELNQIEKYAFTVVSDPSFSKTQWHFILIGNDIDDFVKNKLKGTENNTTLDKKDNYKISVLKWSDIIQNNKLRYQYFQDNAELKISADDISGDLNKRWSKVAKTDKSQK